MSARLDRPTRMPFGVMADAVHPEPGKPAPTHIIPASDVTLDMATGDNVIMVDGHTRPPVSQPDTLAIRETSPTTR